MPQLKITKSAYTTDTWNVHSCYTLASDEYALSPRSKSDTSVVVTKDVVKEEPGYYSVSATCSELSGEATSSWSGYNQAGDYWMQNWNWTAD